MGTAASVAGVEYLANSSLVTILTRSWVHWAERIVAMSNSNGVSCTRAQVAAGYSLASRAATWRACFLLFAIVAGIVRRAAYEYVANKLSPARFAAASSQRRRCWPV